MKPSASTRGARLAALLALPLLLSCGEAELPRPNVLLLSIDCLNGRQLEGAVEAGLTPTLARIAGDSMVFERAYAHSPWTNPSHMSMLSGLYPSQHGRNVPFRLMIEFNEAFDREPAFETLPELLSAAGYSTAAFVGSGPTASDFGLGRGFNRFFESRKDAKFTDLPATVAEVEAWLEAWEGDPFFLFVHTFDFHSPFPKGYDRVRSALAYVDEWVAALVALLDQRGLYDSTLVVVTGDHGSRMIRTEGKCCLHGAGHYEENLRVPLLLKLPDSRQRGPSERIARHVDLLPTVLEAADVSAEDYRGPGQSLLEVFSGDSRPVLSFSEADARCVKRYGLVSETHKYIYTPHDAEQELLRGSDWFMDKTCDRCVDLPPVEELFDLAADPFEENDLLAGSGDADLAGELAFFRRALQEHLNLPRHYSISPPSASAEKLDSELLDDLRALGYID